MSTAIEEMSARCPEKNHIFQATKDDALNLLDALRTNILDMEDFTQFPEDANGVIIYVLLKQYLDRCPDDGDFNYIYQGYQVIL